MNTLTWRLPALSQKGYIAVIYDKTKSDYSVLPDSQNFAWFGNHILRTLAKFTGAIPRWEKNLETLLNKSEKLIEKFASIY
jgi:hypothetical protein